MTDYEHGYAAGAAAERERCAQIAEQTEIVLSEDPFRKWSMTGRQVAVAIRAQPSAPPEASK